MGSGGGGLLTPKPKPTGDLSEAKTANGGLSLEWRRAKPQIPKAPCAHTVYTSCLYIGTSLRPLRIYCIGTPNPREDLVIWGPILLRVLHRNPPLRDLLLMDPPGGLGHGAPGTKPGSLKLQLLTHQTRNPKPRAETVNPKP